MLQKFSVNDVYFYTTVQVRITEHPEAITGYVGRSASISCTARGIPSLTILWYKSGENKSIMEGPDINITVTVRAPVYESTLTYLDLTPSDAGAYFCVAMNNLTSGVFEVTSNSAILTVVCKYRFERNLSQQTNISMKYELLVCCYGNNSCVYFYLHEGFKVKWMHSLDLTFWQWNNFSRKSCLCVNN